MRLCCALLTTLLVIARPAAAEKTVSPARRAAAIAAAVVPGVVLHGAGSWVAGEKQTAKKLVVAEAGGVVLLAIAGGLVGGTGGNPYTVPAVPLVVAGGAVFMTTWFTDIWVAAGGNRSCAQPLAQPRWSVEAGETWQHDAYHGRLLGRAAGRIELGRVDIGAAALAHVGGESWLGYGDVRVRVLGAPATGRVVADGSRLWVRVGGRLQRDDEDRVTQAVGELEVGGRLDLRRIDVMTHPAFAEFSAGVGANHVTYAGTESELDSILLSRFAWGAYLPTGEWALYYDHRRDGLAGGIAAWRAAGFVGSVGATADVGVYGPWAVRGELQIGNAWVSTLALSYRGGL